MSITAIAIEIDAGSNLHNRSTIPLILCLTKPTIISGRIYRCILKKQPRVPRPLSFSRRQ